MIFKRRLAFCLFLLSCYCISFTASQHGDDFRFDTDDLQVVFSDPTETAIKQPSHHHYSKEFAKCPPGESKMMLTLLLRSLKWSDIGEKKKEKAIRKLSRFFLIPTKFIKVDDIHTSEMLEMLKHSINKSNNLLNTKETVGRVEFMIGCGDTLFVNSKTVAHRVNDYVKLGKLEDLSGLPFQWWNIWAKHVKSRVQRTKRQTEGSGASENEGDDYYDYVDEGDEIEEEEEDDDGEVSEIDLPPKASQGKKVSSQVTTASTTTTEEKRVTEDESNYDDEYEDEDTANNNNNNNNFNEDKVTTARTRTTLPVAAYSSTQPPLAEVITQTPQFKTSFDYDDEEISSTSSTVPSLEVTSEPTDLTQSSEEPDNGDVEENENTAPFVVKRIKKLQATSGKAFSLKLEEAIFDDDEDKKDLVLELLDKNGQQLPSNSWIRFDPEKQEIYGLPLEKDVSQHEFRIRATDKGGLSANEYVDVTVQQHKSFRSVNHEIYIQITLDKKFINASSVDWEIRLIKGIVEVLGDDSINSVIVRDVRPNPREDNKFTFVFSNDSLPKDKCSDKELANLMERLTMKALNDAMQGEIYVRTVEKDSIGSCQVISTPHIPIATARNFPPTVRNPIDSVQATVGQLLILEVPDDTFYDPEDQTDLRLQLLNEDRTPLDPSHWLQFDSKNKEFFGVPMVSTQHKFEERYVMVAYDKKNLTANDALIVEVTNKHYRQDYSATFEFQLDTPYEQFQLAAIKRKFLERIALFFEDLDTDQIVMKSVKKLNSLGRISVVIQNTTLYNEGEMCPKDRIRKLKNQLVAQDGSVQDGIKQALGSEFNVLKISVARAGKCAAGDSPTHEETIPVDNSNEYDPFKVTDEVLITYVLPSAIILLMLLIALLIACLLYKRRNTGKMELGDEEERKSFRSKGIPVIFQDELDEKPEIVTKSPVILKDEKPPLLPQYNGMNGQDGDDDNLDQYIPPQGLPLMGSRESRGKSPVTPSYRKPPPYVSP